MWGHFNDNLLAGGLYGANDSRQKYFLWCLYCVCVLIYGIRGYTHARIYMYRVFNNAMKGDENKITISILITLVISSYRKVAIKF